MTFEQWKSVADKSVQSDPRVPAAVLANPEEGLQMFHDSVMAEWSVEKKNDIVTKAQYILQNLSQQNEEGHSRAIALAMHHYRLYRSDKNNHPNAMHKMIEEFMDDKVSALLNIKSAETLKAAFDLTERFFPEQVNGKQKWSDESQWAARTMNIVIAHALDRCITEGDLGVIAGFMRRKIMHPQKNMTEQDRYFNQQIALKGMEFKSASSLKIACDHIFYPDEGYRSASYHYAFQEKAEPLRKLFAMMPAYDLTSDVKLTEYLAKRIIDNLNYWREPIEEKHRTVAVESLRDLSMKALQHKGQEHLKYAMSITDYLLEKTKYDVGTIRRQKPAFLDSKDLKDYNGKKKAALHVLKKIPQHALNIYGSIADTILGDDNDFMLVVDDLRLIDLANEANNKQWHVWDTMDDGDPKPVPEACVQENMERFRQIMNRYFQYLDRSLADHRATGISSARTAIEKSPALLSGRFQDDKLKFTNTLLLKWINSNLDFKNLQEKLKLYHVMADTITERQLAPAPEKPWLEKFGDSVKAVTIGSDHLPDRMSNYKETIVLGMDFIVNRSQNFPKTDAVRDLREEAVQLALKTAEPGTLLGNLAKETAVNVYNLNNQDPS